MALSELEFMRLTPVLRPTGNEFVETFTKAIHSCSKLAQIRRKVDETREQGGDEFAMVKAKKKRARCDDLIDKLQHIEDVQARHTYTLSLLTRSTPPAPPLFLNSSSRLLTSIANQHDSHSSVDSLDEAFPWRTDFSAPCSRSASTRATPFVSHSAV